MQGETITVRSNIKGTAYLVPRTTVIESKEQLEQLVINKSATKVTILEVDTDIEILTTDLAEGDYVIYLVNTENTIVAESSTIVTISDLQKKWIEQNVGESATLYGLAMSLDEIVATGTKGKSYVSTDGINWTAHLLPLKNDLEQNGMDLREHEGQYLVVTNRSQLVSSVDGKEWTATNISGSGNFYSIFATPSIMIATGDMGMIYTSEDDGSTWVQQRGMVGSSLRDVVTDGTTFVTVGDNSAIYSSTDGKTWTQRPLMYAGGVLYSVAWGNGTFVTVGQNGTVGTSTDGIEWLLRDNPRPTQNDLYKVIWDDGKFIAVGASGTVLYSVDGITWEDDSIETTTNLWSIAKDSTKIIVGGQSGKVFIKNK